MKVIIPIDTHHCDICIYKAQCYSQFGKLKDFWPKLLSSVRRTELKESEFTKTVRRSEVQLIGLLKSVWPRCYQFHTATRSLHCLWRWWIDSLIPKWKNIKRILNSEFWQTPRYQRWLLRWNLHRWRVMRFTTTCAERHSFFIQDWLKND